MPRKIRAREPSFKETWSIEIPPSGLGGDDRPCSPSAHPAEQFACPIDHRSLRPGRVFIKIPGVMRGAMAFDTKGSTGPRSRWKNGVWASCTSVGAWDEEAAPRVPWSILPPPCRGSPNKEGWSRGLEPPCGLEDIVSWSCLPPRRHEFIYPNPSDRVPEDPATKAQLDPVQRGEKAYRGG